MPNHNIRRITKNDIPELVEMSERSFYGSNYQNFGTYDKDYIRDFSYAIFDSPLFIGFVGEDTTGKLIGFITGLVSPNVFSREKMAVEHMWWVDEEYRNSSIGVRLFLAFEKDAELKGCSYIATGSAEGRYNLDRMYSKLGYEKVSSIHMRKV